MIAVACGARQQIRGVRPGLGLAQGEAADPFAAGEFWQKALLLRFRAEFDDRPASDRIVHAQNGRARALARRDFLQNANIGDSAYVRSSICFRRRHAEKTELPHFDNLRRRKSAFPVTVGGGRRQFLPRVVAGHVADLALRFRQQHDRSLRASRWPWPWLRRRRCTARRRRASIPVAPGPPAE